MSYPLRPAEPEEMDQFGDLTAYAYAGAFGDGADNLAKHANRPEWTLCAFDGPKMIASYATVPFKARANGQAIALGGVTTVATAPEYRRRGLLRRITQRALREQHEAGQPVAALWASQAAIYQRYGYAASSQLLRYEVDTADLRLLAEPGDGLTVTREAVADAFEDLKDCYRSYVAERTLYLHRSTALWQNSVLGEDAQTGPLHLAVCRDDAGAIRGYVAYHLRADRHEHRARAQGIEIKDLAWLDIDACRSLWSFLSRHDLVGRIRWQTAPMDDPLPELVAEPRMLHTDPGEGTWLRVVDAEGALGGRGYDRDGELTLALPEDPLTPWNEGTYRLTVSNGSAEVERISGAAELRLGIKALASAWCGYRSVRKLAAWGLVDGDEDAVLRADALFATAHAPHCPDHF